MTSYKLIWEDKFEGGELNKKFWNVESFNKPPNEELQSYTNRKDNVCVGKDENGNSCLIITAKREEFNGQPFTSGRINTKKKFAFKYGKLEASIKLPKTSNGIWPAFWLMGNDYDEVKWPDCGEIDIIEFGHVNGIKNGTQDRYFNGSLHWGPHGDKKKHASNYVTYDYSLQDDKYHLYTMIWDENKISMYVDLDTHPDAKPYFEVAIPKSNDPSMSGYFFHKEFYIIFNVAVGGGYTGIKDPTKITALNNENGQKVKMFVRNVRVFQKDESSDKNEESVTKFLANLFQRPDIVKTETEKVDIILDKYLHSTESPELWESLFEYVDFQKLPVEYFNKIKEYRKNDLLFQKIFRMAFEKPYSNKKIIRALFIIPNESRVNDFTFINKLNEMNCLYAITPTITTYSVFMSKNKERFLSNDIIIIGGNDMSYSSFANKENETTPITEKGLKEFVEIIKRGKPVLFLHDFINLYCKDIFKDIFGDFKEVQGYKWSKSIHFKDDVLQNDYNSPFKLPKNIRVNTTHESFQFDEKYKVIAFDNNEHYYIESGIAGQSEACHSVELTEDEEKLLFNTIVHLYNKANHQ